MILVLNVADEISNNFDLCWCKLVSNDGKVSVLFVHKLSNVHTKMVCVIAVILVTPNKTAKTIDFQTTPPTF